MKTKKLTIKAYIAKLKKLKNLHWYLTKSGDIRCHLNGHRCCPITVFQSSYVSLEEVYDYALPGMDWALLRKIVNAADISDHCLDERAVLMLRKRIIEAVGLTEAVGLSDEN